MPLKTHQDDMPSINLTPMIDIVFNLIIFFMVSTRFTEMERQVEVSVPKVGDVSALQEASSRQTINVLRDGRITLGSQPVTLPELTARLTAARRQTEQLDVTVRGAGQSELQTLAA